jgi:hypothetical protein
VKPSKRTIGWTFESRRRLITPGSYLLSPFTPVHFCSPFTTTVYSLFTIFTPIHHLQPFQKTLRVLGPPARSLPCFDLFTDQPF